jgi:nitronate monooxygenase
MSDGGERLTQLLGIEHPLVLGPMAGLSTPELAEAVSRVGGLGSLGAGMMAPEPIRKAIQATKRLTRQPFAVNLFITPRPEVDPLALEAMNQRLDAYRQELGIPRASIEHFAPDFEEQFQVVMEEGVPVFSFTFGLLPADKVRALQRRGTVVIGTATCVREAQALEEVGVDAVVAQGLEAGGHRGTFLVPFEEAQVGLFALVPQMAASVRIPVIASGGIMTGRGVMAAMLLGAAGAQLGSAFLRCPESSASAAYRAALARAEDTSTTLTSAFSGRPARGIRNRFMAEIGSEGIPPYPLQNALTRDIRDAAAKQGKADFLSLWAGQAAGMAMGRPASEVATAIIEELNALRR